MPHGSRRSDAGHAHDEPVPRVIAPVRSHRVVTAEDPLRVLLAEDSPIVSRRLLALIEGLGRPIRTVLAGDGQAAKRMFGDLNPDVAVLDIALPDGNGFDLLATFKLRQPSCVVVMLTTYAYPEFRENAALLGADFFFSKAAEFERVAEVLVSLIAAPSDPRS